MYNPQLDTFLRVADAGYPRNERSTEERTFNGLCFFRYKV